jgi:hypothetical protein
MPDRESELWKSSAPGPWATLERERGTVEISSMGGDGHEVHAPDGVHSVKGHGAAVGLAQETCGAARAGDRSWLDKASRRAAEQRLPAPSR